MGTYPVPHRTYRLFEIEYQVVNLQGGDDICLLITFFLLGEIETGCHCEYNIDFLTVVPFAKDRLFFTRIDAFIPLSLWMGFGLKRGFAVQRPWDSPSGVSAYICFRTLDQG